MTVERINTEIFDQVHQMWAEGTSDIEPLEVDIQNLLDGEGFEVDEIDFWFDNMQVFWRWYCKIYKY